MNRLKELFCAGMVWSAFAQIIGLSAISIVIGSILLGMEYDKIKKYIINLTELYTLGLDTL